MRSLWKGTTDMPQDDTWRPNRHHSNILPLFRNHLTRDTAAMFPPHPNPVASTEHGCRDSRLPAVPHTEDAEEKGRRVVLEMSELSNVYSSHHHDPSSTTESQDPAAEAADPSSQRQDTSEGMSTPPAQAWANGTGKGNTCQLCGAIINDKGDITGTSKSIQRKLVTDEEKRHSSRTVEGRTELDLVQDEVDEAERLLEDAHVAVQAAQNKVTEAAFRVGQPMKKMSQIRNCWRRTRNQPVNDGRSEEAFAGRHQEDKSHV